MAAWFLPATLAGLLGGLGIVDSAQVRGLLGDTQVYGLVDDAQVHGLVGDAQVHGLLLHLHHGARVIAPNLVQLEARLTLGQLDTHLNLVQLLLELARIPANLSMVTCKSGVSSGGAKAG